MGSMERPLGLADVQGGVLRPGPLPLQGGYAGEAGQLHLACSAAGRVRVSLTSLAESIDAQSKACLLSSRQ